MLPPTLAQFLFELHYITIHTFSQLNHLFFPLDTKKSKRLGTLVQE